MKKCCNVKAEALVWHAKAILMYEKRTSCDTT